MKEPVCRISLDLRDMMKCPGFRFHPTDEELIGFHLKKKVFGSPPLREVIAEINVYSYEPWELPSLSILQGGDKEYYFFTVLDKKYGHGSRIHRTTEKGHWKTTGKDHQIYLGARLAGARKTLVYHFGRAPHGKRTNWVMHEFRLEGEEVARTTASEGVFVLCRIFEKSGVGPKNGEQHGATFVEEEWEDDRFLLPSQMIENNNGASGSGDHDNSKVQPDDDRFLLPAPMVEKKNDASGSNHPHNSNVQIPASPPVAQMDQRDTGNSSDLGHVELPETIEDQQHVAHEAPLCFDGSHFPDGQNILEGINGTAENLVYQGALLNGNYLEMDDIDAIAKVCNFDYYPKETEDADPISYDATSIYDDFLKGYTDFVELKDLIGDPIEANPPGLHLTDEYCDKFNEDDNNLEQYKASLDSVSSEKFNEVDNNLEQYLASLDSVSSSSSRQEPDVMDPSIQTPEAPKESAFEGASSSKRKATSFNDAAEDRLADLGDNNDIDGSWGKSIAKRLHGMLDSVPSSPAFAAEDPLKGNVKFVGQSSRTPLSGSVHVEAGMFYVSGFTVASASPKLWPLQKADGYWLGYSTEHLLSNPMSMPEKARLGMLRGGFFLCFLWVLLLAVSCKVGLFVCAR